MATDAPVSPGGHYTVLGAPLSHANTGLGGQPRDTIGAVLLSLQIGSPLVSESDKYLEIEISTKIFPRQENISLLAAPLTILSSKGRRRTGAVSKMVLWKILGGINRNINTNLFLVLLALVMMVLPSAG